MVGWEGSRTLLLAPPSPLLHLSLAQKLGEALPEPCCIHHHTVVLLDLHQPLLPPCWIKKEETSSAPYVLNAEVLSVRHLVIGDLDHDEYDYLNPVLLNTSARDLQRYVDALVSLVAR